jgi:diguanylate cyclase (GGDEF)-like protein
MPGARLRNSSISLRVCHPGHSGPYSAAAILGTMVGAPLPPTPELEHIQHSENAETLRRMRGAAPFAPALEREYLQAHLERVRPRLKIWFILVVLLDLGLAGFQLLSKPVSDPISIVDLALLVPSAGLLVILTWTQLYFPHYFRVGTILIAVHCAAVAAVAVQGATSGQITELGTQMSAVFYFYGLLFRRAVTLCGFAALVFCSVALSEGMPKDALLRDMMVLLLSGGICAAMYWDMERSYRRGFLERRIIGELLARDGLTNLLNRRTLNERLQALWTQALREQVPMAVLLIDVDHFKRYNDTFGHIAGDGALTSVAQVLQQFAQRPLDLAARYGGEEFAIVLYDPTPDYATDTAERIVQAVRNMKIPHNVPSPATATVLSVSVGACVLVPSSEQGVEAAVRVADEALYAAKRDGRDRAIIKTPEPHVQPAAA